MAGSLTITTQNLYRGPARPVMKIMLAWTCTAGGAVSGNYTDYVSGELLRVVFIPGGGGNAPTNLYDIVLNDENGLDILAGQGANLSSTVTTNVIPGVPVKDGTSTFTGAVSLDDKLELQVSNAGASKTGTVILYVR